MKKNATWAIGITLVLGIASCQKTTKRKLANEWKVYSIETVDNQLLNNGDISSSTETMDETSITRTGSYISSNGSTQSSVSYGVVNSHTMTINKNGTWKESSDFSYDNGTQLITETSGTWSFVRKSKEEDFKKNERVLFNTLSEKKSTKNAADPTQEEVVTTAYEVGGRIQIFTVTESKNKELTLESDQNSSHTDSSYVTDKHSQSIKMVLKQK